MLYARPKIERSIRSVGKIESISKYYEDLKDSRKAMPIVGVTNYADYYK